MTVYLSGEIHTDWRQRIRAGTEAADLVVVRFGAKYRQWNAAFDAVFAAALAVAETPEQVVPILDYVSTGKP